MSFDFDIDNLVELILIETMKILKCQYEVSVDVSIASEDEIRELNREHRGIDKVTDVLSFPMNEFDEPGVFSGEAFEASKTMDPETDLLLLGDVVICAQKVKDQAKEYGHSEKREFAFLVVHSLLHLSGYDHIEDEDRRVMEDKQREILEVLGITR